MKHVKILGLLAVAAAALMAFAATASATTVSTTTGGSAETPEIHAVNEGSHVTLQNPIANISCASTVTGKVTSHGASATAEGHVSSLLFTSCTNSWHVTTVNAGTLSVHHQFETNHGGILTSSGAKVDTTRFGITCVYETNNTPIGTVTAGNPATLKIEASIPINTAESGVLCGTANAKWEGSYVTTSALFIAP